MLELGLDGEGGFDGQRGEGVDEQLPDLLVQPGAGDGLADPAAVRDAVALAYVGGDFPVAALVVADGHAQPAGPADDDALQQRGAFAGRPGGAVPAVRGGVGGQPCAVGVVLVQGDVSGVGAGDEGDPFLAGQDGAGQFPAGELDVAVPAEGERAGVAGVVQDPQHDVVGQRLPVELALAGPGPVPPGERQARGVERLHARGGGPGRGEGGEQVRDGAADGGVGVEDDVAGGVVGQPDGQRGDQLPAAGLGHDPAAQPGPDEMQFCFRHLPFHAQKQAVVEVPRVVEAVFVADQRAGHAAELEELVPVGGVAGEPGAFQAEDDPGAAEGHLGDQLLEAFPVGGAGAGVALVDVDHGDLGGGPAQRDRLAAQVVLADRGLGVVQDLLEAGLADINRAVLARWAAVTFEEAVSVSTGAPSPLRAGRDRGGRADQVPASATASPARAWTSSVVTGPGSPAACRRR